MTINRLKLKVGVLTLALVLCANFIYSQTKRIKRPSSRVGVSSVDRFVQNSFDIYDKVYRYDSYAAQGKSLEDEDIDVLENALTDLEELSTSAPDIISDLDGVGMLKQGKATLQMNRAKKALKYSITTAKKLLTEKRAPKEEPEEESSNETTEESSEDTTEGSAENQKNDTAEQETNVSDNLKIDSKFDYVPGDTQLFFDDFSQDFMGDFPINWNTNSGGEIVNINNEKWFQILSGHGNYYIPDIKSLPEEYTIEFDILVDGVDNQTSSGARLQVYLSDDDSFTYGQSYILTSLPFCQYIAIDMKVANYVNRASAGINNGLNVDIRKQVLNEPHISIAVNKQRFRLWVNQKKYIDIPRLVPTEADLNFLKFNATGFKDGKERIFIKNIKVAEGGLDLRRTLMNEGKVSTNGILFDSGSANIKPQSYGIIRQISQVLMQDTNIKLNIIGHTDSDGTDDTNMKLSKERAEAVKTALIEVYKIDGSRLTADGKGESAPIAENSTTEGKAQNRRVEFIKM
ncbi:MAG: OmpA family protein [bacterium]